jgi:hypothetical protein
VTGWRIAYTCGRRQALLAISWRRAALSSSNSTTLASTLFSPVDPLLRPSPDLFLVWSLHAAENKAAALFRALIYVPFKLVDYTATFITSATCLACSALTSADELVPISSSSFSVMSGDSDGVANLRFSPLESVDDATDECDASDAFDSSSSDLVTLCGFFFPWVLAPSIAVGARKVSLAPSADP